jgi:hypothetical protein
MLRRGGLPYLVLGLLFAAACAPLPATPNDFPPPPLTPIVDFPTAAPPTATARPVLRPIFADDLSEARTFFLILKVAMSAGDSTLVAGNVFYPIRLRVYGQPTSISSAAEFERSYDGIFDRQLQEAITRADENDLEPGLDGVKAAGGRVWFNQFCADAACTQGKFLITQINN